MLSWEITQQCVVSNRDGDREAKVPCSNCVAVSEWKWFLTHCFCVYKSMLKLKCSLFLASELSEVEFPCTLPSSGWLPLDIFPDKDFQCLKQSWQWRGKRSMLPWFWIKVCSSFWVKMFQHIVSMYINCWCAPCFWPQSFHMLSCFALRNPLAGFPSISFLLRLSMFQTEIFTSNKSHLVAVSEWKLFQHIVSMYSI